MRDLDGVVYFDGRRQPAERFVTDDVQAGLDRFEELAEDVDPDDPARGGAGLDRRTVADLLDDLQLRGPARRLVEHAAIRDEYTREAGELSALLPAWSARVGADQPDDGVEAFRVRDGNDALPRALAGELRRDGVVLGAPVTRVRSDADGVVVTAGGERVRADVCVVAAPLPAVRDIAFTPALPALLAEAVADVRYGRGAKTMLQYRARPWRERCESGDVLTDLDLSTTWDATMTDGATPGILMAYAAGAPGATATKLSPAARIAPPPTMSSASIGARASCSARRARSHGRPSATAAAHTRAWAPGQLTRYWRALRRPAGRLYFAGEHTDRYAGYMEGALCSGLRVAAAIDRRGR